MKLSKLMTVLNAYANVDPDIDFKYEHNNINFNSCVFDWDNNKLNVIFDSNKEKVPDQDDKIKIIDIFEDKILFSDGSTITFDHDQDCCEWNWADFGTIINDVYRNCWFDKDLEFEFIEDLGFTFGNPGQKIFVPCYSDQNGYYSTSIDIYYNGNKVLSGNCKERID